MEKQREREGKSENARNKQKRRVEKNSGELHSRRLFFQKKSTTCQIFFLKNVFSNKAVKKRKIDLFCSTSFLR